MALLLVKCGASRGTPLGVAEYHAQFLSASSSVGKARRAVTAFARQWFGGTDLADIESAVGEALANCVEHGHADGAIVEVRCRFDGSDLSIEIKDAGRGFDCATARNPAKPPSAALRGYGTYIMRRLMDDIEYTDRGTKVRLVKRRPRAKSAETERERFG